MSFLIPRNDERRNEWSDISGIKNSSNEYSEVLRIASLQEWNPALPAPGAALSR